MPLCSKSNLELLPLNLNLLTPDWFGVVFGPIPLPSAFALLAVAALHSALYSRVHASSISEVPPAPMPGGKRRVQIDKGKKHKILKII